MDDWFSSGVNAMSRGLGSRVANQFGNSNPFTAQQYRPGQTNPFTVQRQQTQGNPFSRGLSGGSSGFGTYTQDNPIVMWTQAANAELQKMDAANASPAGSMQSGYGVGQAVAAGGNWAMLDEANPEINAAASKYGVPANLIKSLIRRESSGHWGAGPNYDNTQLTYMNSRGYRIAGYTGITEPAAKAWGYNIEDFAGNRALQIDAMANGLSRLYQSYGGQYGWDGVINAYYSGDPSGGYTPGDSTQYGSTSQYLNDIKGWWSELDASSPGSYGGPSGGAGGNYASAWGGGDYPITQEHGPTPWSTGAGAYMYDYAKSVGVQGHPGLDVGMPAGTSIYTPAAGTVVIAGGSGYYYDSRGDGPGRGEFRLQMDNGDILILGHMESISLVPGQRIQAGAYVGKSGTLNGDHLHYEVRTSTPGATSSGYTAVDPRTYFSGGGTLTSPGGSPNFSSQTPSSGLWWKQKPSEIFRSL